MCARLGDAQLHLTDSQVAVQIRQHWGAAQYLAASRAALADGVIWRLPAEPGAATLRERIKSAMQAGSVAEVLVEMNDDPRQRTALYLNGKGLGQFAIHEREDQDRT